ncbi:Hydroxylase/desaturase CTB9 [Paramyrothecium foliicola]|nr:Hydroxylase/desaturase CTB9 [Paramyrothecium foliicola]
MSSALACLPPQDISVKLRYLKRCEVYKAIRPYTLACKVDDDFPTNNLIFEEGPLEHLTDVRGLLPGDLTLSKNGFKMVQNAFKSPATGEEVIQKPGGYLDEVRELVRKTLAEEGIAVERVQVINWVFRTAKNKSIFENADLASGKDFRGFAPDTYVHNDCNYYGGDKRIRALLGSEADKVLESNRIRLINAWKPINNPIEDCNLAICDASTVQHDKCIHGDFIITPDYISQTNYAAPCEEQKWYWISNQQTDEVTMFMQHDTDETSNTRSFWKDDPMKCKVHRESVEVRVMAICPK